MVIKSGQIFAIAAEDSRFRDRATVKSIKNNKCSIRILNSACLAPGERERELSFWFSLTGGGGGGGAVHGGRRASVCQGNKLSCFHSA